ncbi:MAG TPA: OmpA family protein [Bacteroidia bacterium]|nr:OmpA family protein [Bacteroidia bacterium]
MFVTEKIQKQQKNRLPGYASIVPFEGDACVGFLTVQGGFEYICGSFTEPLMKDSVYTVSFALATINNADFSKQRIGVYFTEEENPYYKPKGMRKLPWKPQITLDSAEVVEETGYWTVYSMTYKAAGGERSFVIGDYTDIHRKTERTAPEAAYFYVDSLFIGIPRYDEMPEEIVIDTAVTIAEITPNDAAIAAGKTLTLENIYFETNKSRILPESYQPLYDIIIELKLQPNLKVQIVGHTDVHGKPADNQKLSEERAKAVAAFFISKGIDASRITTKGYGSSRPLGDDDQKNRRVEFIFTE